MRVTLIAAITGSLLTAPATAQESASPPAAASGCCCKVAGLGAGCQGAAQTAATAPADETSPPTAPGTPGMTSAEHDNIFNLLSAHAAITRRVEAVDGGVRTTTTTSDPALLPRLREHVRQMALHLEQNRPVRLWDPAFREVFAHSSEIKLTFEDVENGITVVETGTTPEAVKAIRVHASKVNAFVSGGHQAARPPWAGGGGRGRMTTPAPAEPD